MNKITPHSSFRKTTDIVKSTEKNWLKLLFWFTFFMAFPAIVIVQNISVFIFGAIILFTLRYIRGPLLSFRNPAQWWAVLFAAGAIISVANIPPDSSPNALERSLAVLPNYVYWSVLVVFMITHRRLINLDIVYKALFWGVSIAVIYYVLLQDYLSSLPAFVSLSPNGFAFLLVCFAPVAVYYVRKIKRIKWALVYLMLLVLVLLLTGRRAGMVLVFLGGIGVLFAEQITWKRILITLSVIPILAYALYTRPVESLVLQSSERVHLMIYETGKIQKEDRSYLDRIAMIKKGIAIFNRYPYTGIGLGNFTNYEIDFDRSFEGAKYVVNKTNIQRKSAHNSYIGVLSEGGIILFIPLLLIFTYNIKHIIFNYNRLASYLPIYIGIIAMSIHLYFISAIVNVFAWYLIGLACAVTSISKRK